MNTDQSTNISRTPLDISMFQFSTETRQCTYADTNAYEDPEPYFLLLFTIILLELRLAHRDLNIGALRAVPRCPPWWQATSRSPRQELTPLTMPFQFRPFSGKQPKVVHWLKRCGQPTRWETYIVQCSAVELLFMIFTIIKLYVLILIELLSTWDHFYIMISLGVLIVCTHK